MILVEAKIDSKIHIYRADLFRMAHQTSQSHVFLRFCQPSSTRLATKLQCLARAPSGTRTFVLPKERHRQATESQTRSTPTLRMKTQKMPSNTSPKTLCQSPESFGSAQLRPSPTWRLAVLPDGCLTRGTIRKLDFNNL